MPVLELRQKIEFNVDQMTIDRVEALAAINGLDVDAWFRRLVDDLVAQSSRHMFEDHIEIEEVRKPVFAVIEWIANKVHPLREKARALLDQGLHFTETDKPKIAKKRRSEKIKVKLEEIKEKVSLAKDKTSEEKLIEKTKEA